MRHLLLTTAFLAVALLEASCIYEDSVVVDDGRFYMELSFSDATPETRTLGPDTEDEIEGEKTISDLSVYLVNKHEPYTIYKIDGVAHIEAQKRSALIPIPIERKGVYYMYVVTNTAGNSAYRPNSVYEDEFIGQYGPFDYQNAKKFFTPDHFMMTNVQNSVRLNQESREPSDGYAGIEVNLTGDHPMDNPLQVKVELERLALKVVVKEDAAMTVKPLGTAIYGTDHNHRLATMDVDGFCLMNCATNINLIQQWTKATGWTDAGTPKGWPELLLSSPSSDPEYSIQTGYYNRWADIVSPTSYEISSSIEFVDAGVPMYCFENNSPYYDVLPDKSGSQIKDFALAKTKMKGRTTAVVIRVRCGLVDEGYLTEDLIVDPEEGNWTKADVNYSTFYQYKGVCYSDLALLVSKNPELAGISTVSALRIAGVKVYENGNMYYVHWIKDMNYTDDGAHYYSVMRNTSYGLNVTKIDAFGDDIPAGEDYNEFDPIDVGDGRLEIIPSIRDWEIFDLHHAL